MTSLELFNTSMLSHKNYYKKYSTISNFYIDNIDNIISINKDTDLNLIEKLKTKNYIKDFVFERIFLASNIKNYIYDNNLKIFKAKDDYFFVLIYFFGSYNAYKLDQTNELISFIQKYKLKRISI